MIPNYGKSQQITDLAMVLCDTTIVFLDSKSQNIIQCCQLFPSSFLWSFRVIGSNAILDEQNISNMECIQYFVNQQIKSNFFNFERYDDIP